MSCLPVSKYRCVALVMILGGIIPIYHFMLMRYKKQQFFSRRPSKVNDLKLIFLINNGSICNSDTDIVILVHSFHPYADRRIAIRKSWGSNAKTSYNPEGDKSIGLAFLFGVHEEDKWNKILKNESDTYGDIIQGDFLESYSNLTYKSLFMLKYMVEFCPKAKYMMKTDDDMFINVPFLTAELKKYKFIRGIVGAYEPNAEVRRSGKWAITKEVYPFQNWPNYMAGAAYVISTDLLKDLFETSKYVPIVIFEDVFVTGILAKIVGAKHLSMNGFAHAYSSRPGACDFIKNRFITGTDMTPKVMLEVWKDMKEMPRDKC